MIQTRHKNKKVFVAMSGGVDSSVVAGLMKEQGCEVVGVTMCFNITHPDTKKPSCCGVEGIEDARRAAQILDIPHYVFNFARDINEKIIDNFTGEYLSGRTPNPCVQCNQHLKFGSLYQKVMTLGAGVLATGHYAKVEQNSQSRRFELKKGKDPQKDQSYFLYSMRKETLPNVWMPLGALTKVQVRGLARKYKLNTAEKPESQDICFVPSTGYQKFIEDRVGNEMMVPGPFVDEAGKVVGRHKGIAYYTIGQRDKLGLALGYPVYVYRIEQETNTVYVGSLARLYAKALVASQMNYLGVDPPVENFKVKAKIRYNAQEADADLTSLEGDFARLDFVEPQKSITPGQSVVLYRDDVVVAGGIIERAIA
jgi:tRNA-specific 2-thiouridylase